MRALELARHQRDELRVEVEYMRRENQRLSTQLFIALERIETTDG